MGEREELLRAADSFDDVLVDSDGLCLWTDVANALAIMRRKLADYTRHPAQSAPVPGSVRAALEQIIRADDHVDSQEMHEAIQAGRTALRAPEAADAGAVAWRWHPKDMPGHGWTYTESKNRAKWCLLYEHPCEPLYASPTDAGIAAPPERVEISDEDMRDLLSSKDVGSGRAKLRRLMSLKSTAAPPAASADAVKEAVETEIERWETDKRTIYHDCEVLLSLDRIRAALPTAPVAGDDAGMRATLERISEIADGRDQLDGFPRANHERLRRLAEIKAFVIEALKDLPPATPCTPTSTERGGVS